MSAHDHTSYIHSLLARFHTGKALPEPPAFSKALKQLAFDYTPEAIARVDRLLAQLRRELKPKPDDFLAVPKNRSFFFLLAFMVCEAVARYRGASAYWTDYAGLQALRAERGIAQNFPENFSTALVCEIEGEGLLFPLSYLCAALFNDPPGSVVAGADTIMRRAVDVPVLSDPGQGVAALAKNGPAWQLGLALGDSARLCIQVHLDGGSTHFAPQLLQQQADGQTLITSLMYDSADEGIESAHYRMNNPEDGLVAQALAYDGFIGLPRFRSDALILEGVCHLGATPLRASLALPYWPATDDRRLALHDFRLLGFSGDETARERLRAGLFSRVNATGKPGPSTRESAEALAESLWQTYYVHEDDKTHLAARRAALPPLPWESETPEAEEEHSETVSLDDFNAADWQSALPDAEAEARQLQEAEYRGLTKDPLNASIHNFPTLLRKGRVVWGTLIQANGDLFKPGTGNLPAEVVYSIDGSVPPKVLRSVAQALFALRQQLPPQADDALKKCADYLNAETVRVFGWPVPASLAPAPGLPDRLPDSLRISTLWVVRKHLPHGYLANNVLPLLVSDACPGHVMVVPDDAWPTALLVQWASFFKGGK